MTDKMYNDLPFQAALAISLRNNYTLAGPYTGYQVSSLYSIHISFDPAIHVTVIGLDIKVAGEKVSEYDQEIPQSHTADQPMAP